MSLTFRFTDRMDANNYDMLTWILIVSSILSVGLAYFAFRMACVYGHAEDKYNYPGIDTSKW